MIKNNSLQTTLKNSISFSGISLHKGIISNLIIKPAKEDTGIIFKRIDKINNNIIKANYNSVSNTMMCTQLSNEYNLSISTVEHLMAAFIGFGIDNALVEVDCSELPILDGSSSNYIKAFKKIGLKYLESPRKVIHVLKKVTITENDRYISIEPYDNLKINIEIKHDCELINSQSYSFELLDGAFENYLMNARTYGFKEHASMLIKKGLALGASESNALIFDGNSVINHSGLRYQNEPVRHKVLDCLGDIFMAGYRINGMVNGYKSGHELNNKLMHALFSNNENWCFKKYQNPKIQNNDNTEEKIVAIA